jgi:hypothetical protein
MTSRIYYLSLLIQVSELKVLFFFDVNVTASRRFRLLFFSQDSLDFCEFGVNYKLVLRAKYKDLDVAVKQFSLGQENKTVPEWFMKEVTLQRYPLF